MTKEFAVPILLPGDPTAPLQAASKQYVDSVAAGGVGSPCPDIPWFDLTLVNGWEDYGSGYSPAGACRIGGIVFLRGLVRNGANGTIATLPEGMRPSGRDIWVGGSASVGPASAGTAHSHSPGTNRVDVLADGTISYIAPSTGYVDLAQISFPAVGCGVGGTWPNVGDQAVDIMTGLVNSGTLVAGTPTTVAVTFPVPFPAAGPVPRVTATLDSVLGGVNVFVGVSAVTRTGFNITFRRDTSTFAMDAHWHAIGGNTFGSGGLGPAPSWHRIGAYGTETNGTFSNTFQNVGTVAIPEEHWIAGRIFRATWSGNLLNNTAGDYTAFYLRYGSGASNGIATQQMLDLVQDQRAASRRMFLTAVAECTWPLPGAVSGTPYNIVAVINSASSATQSRHYAGAGAPIWLFVDAFY